MDPALQQQLAEYLKAFLASAKQGAAFVTEQAPLVVQEKIVYGRAVETALLVIAIGAIVGCVKVFRWGWAYESNNWADDSGPAAWISSLVGGALLSIWATYQLTVVAQVWFAPRLYILEWAMSMTRTVAK